MDGRSTGLRGLAALVMALAVGGPAVAGPPYVTDDPAPTDTGHWEIYNFVDGLDAGGSWAGEAGLDLNYGAAPGIQLTAVLPAAYSTGDFNAAGAGMVELAFKYRFLRPPDDSPLPDVAFFPRVFLPTAGKGLGYNGVDVLLPIWAEKDFGAWSVFGGGGWQYNAGPGDHSFFTGGLAITRQVSTPLQLGVELYGHTRDLTTDRDFVGVNLGADYRLTKHWSLLVSGGPGLDGASADGKWDFYFSLKADY
jgi:hypothetical protein